MIIDHGHHPQVVLYVADLDHSVPESGFEGLK